LPRSNTHNKEVEVAHPVAPPPPSEMGLKDTGVVAPNERLRLLLDFADYADPDTPYMYHCHILEHEYAGMMGQFVVKA